MTGHEVKLGIAICTPIPFVRAPNGQLVKERITVDWHRARMAMGVPTNIIMAELAVDGLEIGEARCVAVQKMFEAPTTPEFILFIDYDVVVPFDALTKLFFRARCYPDYDIIAGVYCSKGSPSEPLIYMHDSEGPYWDWAVGDLIFDLASVHMGLTLIRTSLFERLESTDEKPWFQSRNDRSVVDGKMTSFRGTEDIYFCKRAREEAGAKIMVDSSVYCGHQDIATGRLYALPLDSPPVLRAKGWLDFHGKDKDDPEIKRALDIGAGDTRRTWEAHRTFTTDIREGVGADYVQDTRWLNLPDEHFDLVASSHHLEHIGRADQERVWSEMFRILKPGGKMEHIVPNVSWAAQMICDGNVDEHVMNVLYGAQEAHGYARELNTHFFAYTPETARALAETCGLVNVEIVTYRDDPDLFYNMIIKGKKPERVADDVSDESEPAIAGSLEEAG